MSLPRFSQRILSNTAYWLDEIKRLKDRRYDSLDEEWPNLQQSVRIALEFPETNAAAAEMWVALLGYVESRGLLDAWLQMAYAICDFVTELPPETAGRIANELGFFFCRAKKFEEATAMHELALDISGAHGDQLQRWLAILGRADTFVAEGKHTEAKPLVRQVIPNLEELDTSRLHLASALNLLGLIEQTHGNYDRSKPVFRQAFTIYSEEGHRRKAIKVLTNLSMSLRMDGQPLDAIEVITETEHLLEPGKEIEAWTNYYLNLGTAWFVEGDYGKAKACFLKIDQAYLEENGLLEHLVHTTNNLGNVALKEAEWELACDYLRYSISISRKINKRLEIANSLGDLAEALANLGGTAEALACLEEAIEILRAYPENAWAARRLIAIENQNAAMLHSRN